MSIHTHLIILRNLTQKVGEANANQVSLVLNLNLQLAWMEITNALLNYYVGQFVNATAIILFAYLRNYL